MIIIADFINNYYSLRRVLQMSGETGCKHIRYNCFRSILYIMYCILSKKRKGHALKGEKAAVAHFKIRSEADLI